MLKRFYSTKSSSSDLIVIGGGPGGYVAAIKAAQLGLSVTCIEKRGTLGGTCLNVGCIPSKSLLNNTHLFHQATHDFDKRGIEIDGKIKMNIGKLMAAKEKSVSSLTKGIEFLFKKNGVNYVKGEGKFVSPTQVAVGNQVFTGKNILIATGSEPSTFPGITIDEKNIVTSTGALSLNSIPEKLVVIGGGVIGLELGSVWNRLGSSVTVIEYMDQIGAGMDADLAKNFQKILSKQNMKFMCGTKVLGAQVNNGKVTVNLEGVKDKKKQEIVADVVLLSVGRKPHTENLNLEKAGVKIDQKGRVAVKKNFATNVPNIYAIGDVIEGAMLAHKAEEEGIACVENLVDGHGHVNYEAIPSVIYTHPEVAWVGKNEQELKAAGVKYSVGTFPFSANSRAKTNDDSEGLVKIITEAETDRILGCHIIGPNAGEMIAEAVLALEYGASSEDIARTCHAHPTLSEALKEACMASHGNKKAIHV
jgi:dihydrolipoamide dehydrogenase